MSNTQVASLYRAYTEACDRASKYAGKLQLLDGMRRDPVSPAAWDKAARLARLSTVALDAFHAARIEAGIVSTEAIVALITEAGRA